MKLYHGSNMEIRNPMIIESNRALDFGKGFYLTTSLEQAINWSKSTTKRREEGQPTISVFVISDNDLNNLNKLEFSSANEEWLEFVTNNRKKITISDNYDIIIGPVANDNTMPVIDLYIQGFINEKEAIERLLPQKLKDQIVFKNDNALSYLKYSNTINIEGE